MNELKNIFAGFTWLQLSLLIFGSAVGVLLISAISRLAYHAQKIHLLLIEIQGDLRKMVMFRSMAGDPKEQSALDPQDDPS